MFLFQTSKTVEKQQSITINVGKREIETVNNEIKSALLNLNCQSLTTNITYTYDDAKNLSLKVGTTNKYTYFDLTKRKNVTIQTSQFCTDMSGKNGIESIKMSKVGDDILRLRLTYPPGGDSPDIIDINLKDWSAKYYPENDVDPSHAQPWKLGEPYVEVPKGKLQPNVVSPALAFNLFKQINEGETMNVGISPYNIQAAMCLLYAGADDKTKTAIKNKLNLSGKTDEQILKILSVREEGISTANLIVGSMTKTYTDLIKEYGGEVFKTGNAGDINKWISKQTNGALKNVINGPIENALVTALYFKSTFITQFDESLTAPGTFNCEDGKKTKVNFMSYQEVQKPPYYEGNDFQAVRLDYSNGASLYVFLPKVNEISGKPVDLNQMTTSIQGNWNTMVNQMSTENPIALKMPKTTLSYNTDIKGVIKSLFPGVLDNAGNFSGPTGITTTGFSPDQIIHATNLDINEKGTEMAAVTVVATRGMGAPKTIEMNVDRPFMVAIVKDGNILYLGAIRTLP